MIKRAKTVLNLVSDRLFSLPLVVLYLTDGCNSRCISCDIWQNPRRNMPISLVESLVSTVAELGIRWVLLSGGEAMQHPEWATIAQRFREAGVRVMLLTNGLLVKRQLDLVLNSVDELIVSLDASNAQAYEAIRGVDAFHLVLEGIRGARLGGLPVTTRTTIQHANIDQFHELVRLGAENDINSMSFLPVDVSNNLAFGTRDLTQQFDLLPTLAQVEGLAQTIALLEQTYPDWFVSGLIAESANKLRRTLVHYFNACHGQVPFIAPPCNAPHFSTVINVDGTLSPCYFLPAYHRLTPTSERLSEALNVPTAQALRRAYQNHERPECERCVCPLYKGARDLMRF